MSYSQNFVTFNGDWLLSSGLGASDSDVGTIVFTIDPSGDGTNRTLLDFEFYSRYSLDSANKFYMKIENTAGAAIAEGVSTNTILASGGPVTIAINYDLGASPEVNVEINGVPETMVWTTSPTTGTVKNTGPRFSYFASISSGDKFSGGVSDYFIDMSAQIALSNFYINGSAQDISNVGTPEVFMGGNMWADEQDGNAAQGWNDGFNKGSGGSSVMSGTVVDVAATLNNQTADFNSLTIANAGYYSAVMASGSGTLQDLGTGTCTSVVVDGNKVGFSAVPNAGTIDVETIGGDTATITVNVIAGDYTCSTLNDLANTVQASGLAFGDTLYCRSGEYNLGKADKRLNRLSALVGAWDGTNYVKIKPIDGETDVNIWRIAVTGVTTKDAYYHFTKADDGLSTLNFLGDDVGTFGGSANGILAGVAGAGFVKVTECAFSGGTGTTPAIANFLPSGMRMAGTSGNGNWIIDNNTFDNLFDGVNSEGASEDMIVSNNTLINMWNDCIKFLEGDNVLIEYNLMYNKKYGDGGIHGDFIQGNFTSATADILNTIIRYNIMYRGDGTAGQLDGQGIFLSDNPPGSNIKGALIERNFYLGTFSRGISVNLPEDCIIQYNTILADIPDTTSANPLIGDTSASQGGNLVKNNIAMQAIDGFDDVTDTQTNNQIVTKSTAAYALAFDDPKYEGNVTDPEAEYSVKTGGPLDVIPEVGTWAAPEPTPPVVDAEDIFKAPFSTPFTDIFTQI